MLIDHAIMPLLVMSGVVMALGIASEAPWGERLRADADDGPAPVTAHRGDSGMYDDRIIFGQSAAFSGPAQELGTDVRLGIQAAFHEANQKGGVHGRRLELEILGDFYQPDSAFANTMRLIQAKRVFALIGEMGTPTPRAAVPAAGLFGVPFLAPFTGAEFLRDPEPGHVLNLRASYY